MDDDSFEEAYVPDRIPLEDRQYYANGKMGGRIGWGDKPAMLVVDLTDEFVERAPEQSNNIRSAIQATARLLESVREKGLPVFFVKPDRDFPENDSGTTKSFIRRRNERDSKGNTVVSALEPSDKEYILTKPRASAFFDTHLANLLHNQSIDTLVVTGVTTSGCVRATVVDSHSSNFRTIVPQECVSDHSAISHEVNLFDIDMKYADVTPLDGVLETVARY